MPRLLDILQLEHKSIVDVLGCLERQIERLDADAQPDFDIIRAALDYFAGFPDQCHHPKEDLIFARLTKRDQISAWIVGDLHHAHEQLAEDFRTFSAAVGAVLLEAELPRAELARMARKFIELQRRHVAMEQASFFPAADRALTAEDWRQLEATIPQRVDPLHRDAAEVKYDHLRAAILAWDQEDRSMEQASNVI